MDPHRNSASGGGPNISRSLILIHSLQKPFPPPSVPSGHGQPGGQRLTLRVCVGGRRPPPRARTPNPGCGPGPGPDGGPTSRILGDTRCPSRTGIKYAVRGTPSLRYWWLSGVAVSLCYCDTVFTVLLCCAALMHLFSDVLLYSMHRCIDVAMCCYVPCADASM